jgi:peptidoglycan hydrolase-like protein with peptidoglycan-binding domain
MPFTPRHALRVSVSAAVCFTAVLLALTGALSLAPAANASTSPRVPAVPSGLPSDIEGLAKYVPANSCDPHAKVGTTALANLLVKTYGSHYGIDRTCGTDPLPTSEHYDGRAIDFFLNVHNKAQRTQMRALIGWLLAKDSAGHSYANARRLGVMYLIWNNKIWGSYRASEGWRPYSSCAAHPGAAYDTTCHRNHIHISLSWEGAMKRTSFWTKQVAATDYGPCVESGLNWAAPYTSARSTPCPSHSHVTAPAGSSSLRRTLTTYAGMMLRRGDSGPVVSAVQRAVGTTADGDFGPLTQAAVTGFQRNHDVPATGVVTANTWRALMASQPVSVAKTPASHPSLTKYRSKTLRVGSHGAAVKAVQRRLDLHPAGGHYGTKTKARVQRFQRNHGPRADGVVGSTTWAALGA